jgi:hypothetical protein
MEEKNTMCKIIIIVLMVVLIGSNIAHMSRYNNAEDNYESYISELHSLLGHSTTEAIELDEVDNFVYELDRGYIHINTIQPVGFINYSSGRTGFRTVMYNVAYNLVTEEEVNGSIEIWIGNNTNTAFMTFDVAVANNQEPMREGNIYKFYYIRNAYDFHNVIYYEKIETGRI